MENKTENKNSDEETKTDGAEPRLAMLNHSPSHRLATIVLQDAGCTIVDLPEEREGGKRKGG